MLEFRNWSEIFARHFGLRSKMGVNLDVDANLELGTGVYLDIQ